MAPHAEPGAGGQVSVEPAHEVDPVALSENTHGGALKLTCQAADLSVDDLSNL